MVLRSTARLAKRFATTSPNRAPSLVPPVAESTSQRPCLRRPWLITRWKSAAFFRTALRLLIAPAVTPRLRPRRPDEPGLWRAAPAIPRGHPPFSCGHETRGYACVGQPTADKCVSSFAPVAYNQKSRVLDLETSICVKAIFLSWNAPSTWCTTRMLSLVRPQGPLPDL